jgi:hypothetical protein
MSAFQPYVKGFLCVCDCSWALDKGKPQECWSCGSKGPHLPVATSQSNCKIVKVPPADADLLFSKINELQEMERNEA